MSFSKDKGAGFIKTFLNRKWVGMACLILAWANKCIVSFYHTSIQADKSIYLLFSKEILAGRHPLEPIRFIGSEKVEYVYNNAFSSPFYSIMSLPFLWLTGSAFQTSFLMDVFAWAIYFSGLYFTARIFLKEHWLINLLIIFSGFFLMLYEMQSTPKDHFATGFLLWATYLTAVFFKKQTLKTSILLCVVYLLIVFTKFLYAPLIILFLGFLFYNAFLQKNRRLAGFSACIFMTCLVSILLFYQYWVFLRMNSSSEVIYKPVEEFTKGFFPENLLQFYPFISSSWINTGLWGQKIEKFLHLPQFLRGHVFQTLDILMLVLALIFLRPLFKKIITNQAAFLVLLICTSIIFMTAYMSVRFQEIHFNVLSTQWTYVRNPRFFSFPMVIIQLILVYLLSSPQLLKSWIRYLFIVLIAMECLHGIYFSTKLIAVEGSIGNRASPVYKKIIEDYNQLKIGAYPNLKMATTDLHLRWYAGLQEIPVYVTQQQAKPVADTNSFYLAAHPVDSNLVKNLFLNKHIEKRDTIGSFLTMIIQ